MKSTIICLEDDANMRRHTAELLREKGYYVEEFRRIDQVKEFFNEKKNEIKCIITDLNMADEWLEEYQKESDGGMLSGWVWLQRFVYPSKPDIKTIIYSGYVPYLKDYLRSNQQLHLLERNPIRCVQKGANDDEGFHGLIKTLETFVGKGVE